MDRPRSSTGASQASWGGRKAIGENPVKINAWKKSYFDGMTNFFKDIEDWMALRQGTETGTSRLFLPINRKAKKRRKIFKNQYLGEKDFQRIMKDIWNQEKNMGLGPKCRQKPMECV